MKGFILALAAIFMSISLTGCTMVEPNTEDLIIPPKLSQDQAEISTALTKALGTENYTLKYPSYGEYRSAFVLKNLDSEEGDEAIVFYILGSDSTVRMNILDKNTSGAWESVYDTAGSGTEIYSIDFAPISSKEFDNIIVAWKEQGRTALTVQVYSYEVGILTNLFSGSSSYIHFLDVKQDGYAQMLLLGWRSQNPALQIVRRAGPKVVSRDEIMLNTMLIDFAGVKFGKTEDGQNALFIDEIIDSGTVATEVITIDSSFKMRNRMAPKFTVPTETDDDVPVPDEVDLYAKTRRPTELLCDDLDGNGTIEIPTQQLLPGYHSGGESESIYMTVYNSINRVGMQSAYSTVINREKGYYIMLPHKWRDNVTVKNIPETNQWQFVIYENNTDTLPVVLANIRVLSAQDYRDKFEADNYFLLATRGIFEYHANIPTTDHELSVTKEEVIEMFRLL